MRTAVACLLVSALAHLALFPGFLDWILTGSHANKKGGSRKKLQVRLVERKKPKVASRQRKVVKPKRKVVSRRPKAAKPKVAPRKPRPTKPKRKPRSKPKVAKVKPLARYPKAKQSYPKSKSKPKTRKSPRRRRPKLMTSDHPSTPVSAKPAVVAGGTGKSGDIQADFTEPEPIPVPPEAPVEAEPVPVPDEKPTEPEPAPSEPESPSEPEPTGGESTGPAEAPAPKAPKPKPRPKPKAKPTPKPKPKPKKKPKPEPKPKPKFKPQNANRPVSVSFPKELHLPARFRRETFKTEVRVRAVVSASGSPQLSLRSASGNPDIDDFVLEQVREIAQFQPATDAEGAPKRGRATFTVKIVVD